jgi:hypothetical protein
MLVPPKLGVKECRPTSKVEHANEGRYVQKGTLSPMGFDEVARAASCKRGYGEMAALLTTPGGRLKSLITPLK